MNAAEAAAGHTDMKAFWLSQGLAEYQAERLVSELARRGGQYVDPSWLAGRMQQLASALPGPVGALVYEDSDLLVPELADTERLTQQLVLLKETLPGVDVWHVVNKQPRLLRMPGAAEKLPRIIAKLVQVFPYESSDKKQEVLKMVEEYPSLLMRMEYYLGDKYRMVHDLPVDLQNNILRNYCG